MLSRQIDFSINFSKTGIIGIEELKGLAILGVLLIHSSTVKSLNGSFYTLIAPIALKSLSRFAIPLFIFISGYLHSYIYFDKIDHYNQYKKFLIKKTITILIPYISWSVIFLFYHLVITDQTLHFSLCSIIGYIFLGKASFHLWFLPMIFQFYVLLPVFIYIVKKHLKMPRHQTKVFIFLLCWIAIESFSFLCPLMHFNWKFYWVKSVLFIWYIPYFYLGVYIGVCDRFSIKNLILITKFWECL